MASESDLNLVEEMSVPTEAQEQKPEEEISIPMETQEQEQEEEQNEPTKSPEKQSNLDQSVIIEGKRSRKPTLRLELTESISAKKEFVIPQGNGTPLGEIEYINHQISHASTDALSRMRQICFGGRGTKATIRKHLREFKGFDFDSQSADYQKHLNNLTKLKKEQLRSISTMLGLPSTGRNTDLAERILNFLMKPIDEGKKIPSKKSTKRQPTKKSKENSKNFNFKPGKTLANKPSSELEDSNDVKHEKEEIPSNTNENLV